jgi:hypothetical protein
MTVKRAILILMPTNKMTPEIINAAIAGFELQKLHIDAQIAELRAMLPGGRMEPVATSESPHGTRRKMSAAARKRMKEGQQRRWAKIRDESQPPSASVTPEPPKRKLSAAGRANIVAALKKRWAAAKKAAPAVAKKAGRKAAVKKLPRKTAKASKPSAAGTAAQ